MTAITPLQCHLWQKKTISTSDIGPDTFTVLRTYEDESHFIRRLLQCKDCGQLYFYEFTEEIDWERGEDPQYRTFIPVPSEAEAEVLNQLQPIELLQFFPRLQSDWPANAAAPIVSWIKK
jgi:hypothetical protein